ncbi:MAG: DUF11 domain-containing protein [archaeon]|nr:DUF11 domain-containing protein [archaeon]
MKKGFSKVLALVIAILTLSTFVGLTVHALPTWPSSWIPIDSDPNENGSADDWRDVEYAYYQYDADYLYLKLKCYDTPGSEWPDDGRYKWFIDLDGNMYIQGNTIYNAEYLLFVEDTNADGSGEMYLLQSPFPSNWSTFANKATYQITNPEIGGFQIIDNQIEMYISWISIGDPDSYWLIWATNQANPNLDQMPTTDHPDEEAIAVHDVVAKSQTVVDEKNEPIPTPVSVKPGDQVRIEVVVENQGTQKESFDVTCYFDTSVIGTQRVNNLPAGHSRTLYFVWDTTGVPPDTYDIEAWADSGVEITEINEENNWCTESTAVTIEFHDVAAISQVPTPTSVEKGGTVNIDVTVKNLGDFTETFDVTCYYDSTPIGTQTVTVNPGATDTLSFTWDTSSVDPGIYTIKAVADPNDDIDESDETNNECTSLATVTVYAGEVGKLSVDKAKTSVISGPDPPVVGSETVYELTITVSNTGGSNVENVDVEDTISSDVTFISADPPPVTSPPPKIVWNVGTLTPGASATLTFRVSLTPGSPIEYYLNHASDLIASGDEVDDAYGKTDVTVTAITGPILIISKADSPDPVQPGGTLTYTLTYENIGDTVAYNVIITETYDPLVTFVSANPPPTSGNNVWEITELKVDGPHTIQIIVEVSQEAPDGTVIPNYGTITYSDLLPPEEPDLWEETTVQQQQQFVRSFVGGALVPISLGPLAYQVPVLALTMIAVLATAFFAKRRLKL